MKWTNQAASQDWRQVSDLDDLLVPIQRRVILHLSTESGLVPSTTMSTGDMWSFLGDATTWRSMPLTLCCVARDIWIALRCMEKPTRQQRDCIPSTIFSPGDKRAKKLFGGVWTFFLLIAMRTVVVVVEKVMKSMSPLFAVWQETPTGIIEVDGGWSCKRYVTASSALANEKCRTLIFRGKGDEPENIFCSIDCMMARKNGGKTSGWPQVSRVCWVNTWIG